jgi:hypothetical protein
VEDRGREDKVVKLMLYTMWVCLYCAHSPWCLVRMYFGSVIVLVAYSVLYGLTARKARWLGGVTSAAVIILGELVLQCIISFPIALS